METAVYNPYTFEGYMMSGNNFGDKVSFIWSVADLLRGSYRPNQYKDVKLPMTILRHLDCVLEPTKEFALDSDVLIRICWPTRSLSLNCYIH